MKFIAFLILLIKNPTTIIFYIVFKTFEGENELNILLKENYHLL